MLEIKTREEAAKGADCAMFPVHIQCDGGSVFGFGLFKRELFAAMNMAAMHSQGCYNAGLATPEQRANVALIDADALIAALAQESQEGAR